MPRTVRQSIEQVIGWLFPSADQCSLCGLPGKGMLCESCRKKMPAKADLSFCPVCGRFLWSERPGPCPECLAKPPLFALARSVGPYGGLVKEAVYQYKYRALRSLAEPLGLMMAGLFVRERSFTDADALIPVPLNREKIISRGFNQAELLALKMGRVLNLPVVNCLDRVRSTPSQSKLTREQREINLQGVFQLNADIKYKKVILIDDILTTGATADECSVSLMAGGVASVGVLTFASVVLEKANNDFRPGR